MIALVVLGVLGAHFWRTMTFWFDIKLIRAARLQRDDRIGRRLARLQGLCGAAMMFQIALIAALGIAMVLG